MFVNPMTTHLLYFFSLIRRVSEIKLGVGLMFLALVFLCSLALCVYRESLRRGPL